MTLLKENKNKSKPPPKTQKSSHYRQQNWYDPLALSRQAAVLLHHALLEHAHDASRNIFSMCRQKTSNQFSVPPLRIKLHPPKVTFWEGAWQVHEMASFDDP